MESIVDLIRGLAQWVVDVSGIGPDDKLKLDGPKFADIYLFVFSAALSSIGTMLVGVTAWVLVTRSQKKAVDHENAVRRKDYLESILSDFDYVSNERLVFEVAINERDFFEDPQKAIDGCICMSEKSIHTINWNNVKDLPPVVYWRPLSLKGETVKIIGSSDSVSVDLHGEWAIMYLMKNEACLRAKKAIANCAYGIESGVLTKDSIISVLPDIANMFMKGLFQPIFGVPSMKLDSVRPDSFEEWYFDRYRTHINFLSECIEFSYSRGKRWAFERSYFFNLHPVAAYMVIKSSERARIVLENEGRIAARGVVEVRNLLRNANRAGALRTKIAYFFDDDEVTISIEKDIVTGWRKSESSKENVSNIIREAVQNKYALTDA